MLRFLNLSLTLLFLSSLVLPGRADPRDLITELILTRSPQPTRPLEFLQLLESEGYTVEFHIVANRGWHNPATGSFSSFATVTGKGLEPGDMTFGVFIEPDDRQVLSLQNDWKTQLLVEVIVKDQIHGLKNFWELIGEKSNGRWYYRGSSFDIVADTRTIHRGESAIFGDRLRCSGCHVNGDLVMKERFPYNDWKGEDQALKTGPYSLSSTPSLSSPSGAAAYMVKRAKGPDHLDEAVTRSLEQYVRRLAQVSAEEDRQWLRSLLAPLEVNLLSDTAPLGERPQVEIPADFFLDPLLTGAQPPIKVPLDTYRKALALAGSSFAPDETPGLIESQHAFLVPVRSKADRLKVEQLLANGKLDRELMRRFLSVDYTTPLFSPQRLELMECVPMSWADSKELAMMVDLPPTVSQEKLMAYLQTLRSQASKVENVVDWLKLAHQRRLEIQAAQTSSNSRGAILEGGLGAGGFRRIFPTYQNFQVQPYQWRPNPQTGRLEPRPPVIPRKPKRFQIEA